MKQDDDICDCGHARSLHRHYSGQGNRMYCGRCNCARFQRRLVFRERIERGWTLLRNTLAGKG